MKFSLIILMCFVCCFAFIEDVGAFKALNITDDQNQIISGTINDDLYLGGGNVIINGDILGDLIVVGGNILIKGNVSQDIIAAGGDISIVGNVGDDVRVGGGTIRISGNIGDDLVVAGGQIIQESTVGGDVVFGAGEFITSGQIDGNLTGSGESVTINGKINKNVDIETSNLNLGTNTNIAGKLKYISPAKTTILSGVNPNNVTYIQTTESHEGFSLFWWIIKYLALLFMGLILLLLWPKTYLVAQNISISPLKTLLIGAGLTIGLFIIAFILMITIIGIPLSIVILFLIFLGLYVARVFAAVWMGKIIFKTINKESKSYVELVVGLFVLLIITSIPIIGDILYLIFTFIGIGNVFEMIKSDHNERRIVNSL